MNHEDTLSERGQTQKFFDSFYNDKLTKIENKADTG